MYLDIKYTQEEINSKRERIRKLLFENSKMIKSGVLDKVEDRDLWLLYSFYDEIFLKNYFRDNFKGKLGISFSKRLTSSGGVTKCFGNIQKLPKEDYKFEIKISVNFLFDYYKIDRDKIVNGYNTKDNLEAMLLVFEHELCHMIEFLHTGSSSCKKTPFKTMAKDIFGHTDVYHAMPTKKELAKKVYNIKLGQEVSFEYQGRVLNGIVSAVNKRASVMVEDSRGDYVDKKGKKYLKYYVPLNMLNLPSIYH